MSGILDKMKQILAISLVSLTYQYLYCQESCSGVVIHFEYDQGLVLFEPGNDLWQMGRPGKSVFNASYGGNRAMVTDTLNPYASSSKSYFQIRTINTRGDNQTRLQFYHQFDTDTLKDYGYVMYSIDGGDHWSMCQDTSFLLDSACYQYSEIWQHRYFFEPITGSTSQVEPLFSGSESKWVREEFYFSWYVLSKKGTEGSEFQYCSPDSILFRFYFESDSINNPGDGWMIDNIWVTWDFSGDVPPGMESGVQVFPNPARDEAMISAAIPIARVELYNAQGQIVRRFHPHSESANLDLRGLNEGIYFVRLIGDGTQIGILKMQVIQ